MICPSCEYDNVPGADVCAKCLTDLAPLDAPVGHDRVEQSLLNDPVRSLVPRQPVRIARTETVGAALELMLRESIGAVLVVDEAGALAGILTERDFLTDITLIPNYSNNPVDRYMTADPETVAPTDTLALALRKMDVGGYRHLPVIEDGRPIGILSVKDVVRHLARLCAMT